jgi:tetratricopeptide (TPR) repeat protein
LRSKYDKELIASVKLTIPGYIEETTIKTNIAFPESEGTKSIFPPETVAIRAHLPSKILNLKNTESVEVTVIVDYEGVRRYRPAKATFPVVFLKPGRIPITEDVTPLMAFIHPDDPLVRSFAQQITAQYAQSDWYNILPKTFEKVGDKWRPILNAIQIYESLRQFGLRYVPDPQIPYSNRDKLGFDDVKYPRNFLTSTERAGDCDDVSVLIATLYESVGLRTALVEVPGHVFVLVNTGLYYDPDQSGILALPQEKFICVSGTGDSNWDYHLAIPLDPSQQQDDTFIEAWQNGLRTYNESAKIFIVRQEHKIYPPAYPPRDIKQPNIADFKLIDQRIKGDMQQIVKWQGENNAEQKADDLLSLINAGTELAQKGELAEAKENLLKADAMDEEEQFIAIDNNLGNIARLEGKFEEALAKYQQAHERVPDDVGILLNLSLTHMALGQKDQATPLLWLWKQKTGGSIPVASRLLWISPEPPKEIQGKTAILAWKIHTLLEKVMQADTIEALSLEDFQVSSDDLQEATSGIYWKPANNPSEKP